LGQPRAEPVAPAAHPALAFVGSGRSARGVRFGAGRGLCRRGRRGPAALPRRWPPRGAWL